MAHLELKTKKELATEAKLLAADMQLVNSGGILYVPAQYDTLDIGATPAPNETIWLPLDIEDVQRMAGVQYHTLFYTESEMTSFFYMVRQAAQWHDLKVDDLLIRTQAGLRRLTGTGEIKDPTGSFVPNYLQPTFDPDPTLKAEIRETIVEWLGGEDEEATSLLRHLATCLAPGFSAVKYVLLLGEGRNGKSLLLKMMQKLFGIENIGTVTRQMIADQSPAVTTLNGKLLNLVFDGQAQYLKDSGTEKSLIAGEEISIRELYRNKLTIVQTNALFIEGLNREPKSRDTSTALQRRLVRYHFPNTYDLDHVFERKMTSPEYVGAFLSLLLDHFVKENEVAVMLAPTQRAIELEAEHMFTNSLGLQFVQWVEDEDALGASSLLDVSFKELTQRFKSWRVRENDLGTYSEPDVHAMLNPLFLTERRSVRDGEKITKQRFTTAFKPEARRLLESQKEADGAQDQHGRVVED